MVEVTKIYPVARPGTLQAFCSLVIDGRIAIHDVKIIQDEGKAAWVALPSRSYEDREGNTKYAPQIELVDKDLQDEVRAAVLTAWAARQQTAGPPAPAGELKQRQLIEDLLRQGRLSKAGLKQLRQAVSFPPTAEATGEDWDRLLQACLEAVEGEASDPFAE